MITNITTVWWNKCLQNDAKLEHWLVRLYHNEHDASDRFENFAKEYCKNDPDAYNDFMEIAEEERQHAVLVSKVIKNRGIKFHNYNSSNGRYWRNASKCIINKQTAAAIGAYAEGLSLMRMRIIIRDKNTPLDLREMFKIIEPEESRHAIILQKIATKYGMSEVKECHNAGLEELGLKIKNKK